MNGGRLESGRRPQPGGDSAWLLFLGVLLLGAAPLHPYRTPAAIRESLAESPHAGDCEQCHSMHGQDDIAYDKALLGPDDNTLCDRCHTNASAAGGYGGSWPFVGSAHGPSSHTIWPGPTPPPRTEADAAGKCLNCHDPHGWKDGTGIIPFLAIGREETLCLTCHDGSPAAKNVAFDVISRPYRHPMTTYSGRHKGPDEPLPSDVAAAPVDNRHAECTDCHNPHVGYADRFGPPAPPGISKVNFGVSRLQVQNGAPGAPPGFTYVAAADTVTTPIAEYQICFKCHSSWTTQPTGQTDLARELNPANASFHPVEAPRLDLNIDPAAFTPGWNSTSMTRCVDCHGSGSPGGPRGPHGSNYRYILQQPYTASPAFRTMTTGELCFTCHATNVYYDASPSNPLTASRFNRPGVNQGHAEHVGKRRVPCYSCHVTHGAANLPHLMVTGRVPGMTGYTETPTGGTCQSTCHGVRSYTVNYAR